MPVCVRADVGVVGASPGNGRGRQRLTGIGRGLQDSGGVGPRCEGSAGVEVRLPCFHGGVVATIRLSPIIAACTFNCYFSPFATTNPISTLTCLILN